MVVGATRIELLLPGCTSLKAKRQVMRSIVDRTKARFNVSVAEIEYQDLWQRSALGVAYACENHYQAEKLLDKVTRFIENMNKASIVKEEVFFLKSDSED